MREDWVSVTDTLSIGPDPRNTPSGGQKVCVAYAQDAVKWLMEHGVSFDMANQQVAWACGEAGRLWLTLSVEDQERIMDLWNGARFVGRARDLLILEFGKTGKADTDQRNTMAHWYAKPGKAEWPPKVIDIDIPR
jgi:hypothetical protein